MCHTWGLARSPAELQGGDDGDDGDGGDVPDLVHLVPQLGSKLDPTFSFFPLNDARFLTI